jgi:acyl-CoA reductase-like NAD-dependent aldehyde dehydrogenase
MILELLAAFMSFLESGDRSPATVRNRIRGLADGVTLAASADEFIDVEEPFAGDAAGNIPACTERDVNAAVESAREAQERWAGQSVEARADVIFDYHDRILEERETLLDLVQLETGKARRHAHEELLDLVANCRYYGSRAASYLAPERRDGALPLVTRAETRRHPVGVVGLISPWNYPLNLAVSDAIPALLAGNAVVFKPDEHTPYAVLRAVELLREAGLPSDLCQVVTGHGDVVGPALIDRVDYVGFTGSTATGRRVAARAGNNLVDCSLELGGKNPAIVLPGADLDAAVEGLVHGCFANAGQLCLSIERIYVHEAVYDRFLDAFVDAASAVDLGAGYGWDVELGSLISAEHLDAVERHVDDARDRGATVHTGGSARPDVAPYAFEPTVLTGVTDDMAVGCEETFGPVVSVSPVDSVDEAVARANDSDYGLNASVWAGSENRGIEVAERIDCGTVNVNDPYGAAYGSLDAPMGGMNDSGIGRRHGVEGIHKYTEAQTIASQRVPLTPPSRVPYRLYAGLLTRTMRALKWVDGWR